MLDVSLRELEYVVAVDDERSFTRAALRLHMAQPALSQAIIRLERRLCIVLFERTSRRVSPTPAGARLAEHARDIISRISHALDDVASIPAPPVRIHVSEPSLDTPRRLLFAIRVGNPGLSIPFSMRQTPGHSHTFGVPTTSKMGRHNMRSGINENTTNRRWTQRATSTGLAGVAIAAAVAAAVPAATSAGAVAPSSASAAPTQAMRAEVLPTEVLRSGVLQTGEQIVWRVSPAAALPMPALPAGALDAIPGRHQVASPEVVGQSAGAGAIIGGVVGGVIGFIVGAATAPIIGTVATTLILAGTAAVCATATAGVGCTVLLPLAAVIAAPLTTLGAPIIGAVVGAGIGAVIGGGVGAAIGASYASAPVPAPKQAAATKRVAATNQGFVAPKAVTDLAQDPTVKNIVNAVDRAAQTRPELAPVRNFAAQFLPTK